MTFTPTQGPLDRASRDRDVDELLVRVTDLERYPVGRWIYVGDYPADSDTTPDSPPFQNSWRNAGGGDRRLRFRRTNENQTEIAGAVTGGVVGTVVTTLPALYRITESEYAVGASPGSLVVWMLAANGELSLIAKIAVSTSPPVSLLNWGSNTDTDAVGLTLTFGENTGLFVNNHLGGTLLRIDEDGSLIRMQLGASGAFELLDSSGNPMLSMTDGSPDLHIPAGGSVIADL